MGRTILFSLLGVVIFLLFVSLGDGLAGKLFTMPAGMDPKDMESVKAHAHLIPAGALVTMMIGYGVGALLAGWIVGRFTGNRMATWVLAGLFTFAVVSNLIMIPHPTWFWVSAVVPALCIMIGYRMGEGQRLVAV